MTYEKWKLCMTTTNKYKKPLVMNIDGHMFGFFQYHTNNTDYYFSADKAENKFKLAEYNTVEQKWQKSKNIRKVLDGKTANKIYYNATHYKFTYEEFILCIRKEFKNIKIA